MQYNCIINQVQDIYPVEIMSYNYAKNRTSFLFLLLTFALPGLADRGGVVPLLPVAIADIPVRVLSHPQPPDGLIPLTPAVPQVAPARVPRLFRPADSLVAPLLPVLPDMKGQPDVMDPVQKALERVRDSGQIKPGAAIEAAAAAMAQAALDNSLAALEHRLQGRVLRRVNLSWAPSFAGRADLLQVDAILSLTDGERMALLTQAGLQSRDGKAAANLGLLWRTRVNKEMLIGLNVF